MKYDIRRWSQRGSRRRGGGLIAVVSAFAVVFVAGSLLLHTSFFQTAIGSPTQAGTGRQAIGKIHGHVFDDSSKAQKRWDHLLSQSHYPRHHFHGHSKWTAHIPAGTKPGQGGFPTYRQLSRSSQLSHLTLPAHWTAAFYQFDRRWYLEEYPLDQNSSTHHRLPLYVVLAGRGMSPGLIAKLADMPSVTGDAILIYPTGYEYSWNAGHCCGFAQADGVNDVGWVTSLVKHLESTDSAIDPKSVNAVGFSNGGRLAYDLACSSPGVFQGIAALEAVPAVDCRHLDPTNVEIVAQTLDPILDIASPGARKTMDGYLEPTVVQTVDQWRSLDHCSAQATTTEEGGGTMAHTWSCADHTHVQFTLYPGGGHRWPKGQHSQPSGQQVVVSLLG